METHFRVLALANDPAIRDLLTDVLASRFPMSQASNVLEAADLIGYEHPGLLVIDLDLPVMTGIEFVQILRRFSEYDSLPVLALSTSPFLLSQLGPLAQAAIVEPFSVQDLMQKVQLLVRPTNDTDGPGGPPDDPNQANHDNNRAGGWQTASGPMLKALVYAAWSRALVQRSHQLWEKSDALWHSIQQGQARRDCLIAGKKGLVQARRTLILSNQALRTTAFNPR